MPPTGSNIHHPIHICHPTNVRLISDIQYCPRYTPMLDIRCPDINYQMQARWAVTRTLQTNRYLEKEIKNFPFQEQTALRDVQRTRELTERERLSKSIELLQEASLCFSLRNCLLLFPSLPNTEVLLMDICLEPVRCCEILS